jgi:phage terminase large subunit-like protein
VASDAAIRARLADADMPPCPLINFVPESGYFRYDAARAERAIRFIEEWCVHTKGRFAGKPFILTWWQKDKIIRPLYGRVQWDSQLCEWRRQHSIAWLEVARKQGKSELLSALGLYHLVADGEESGEVYGVAADRDQASLVFNVAKRMVELSKGRRNAAGQSRDLNKFVEIIDSKKRLVYARTNSFYQVLPGDSAGALGVNASAVLFDEVLTQKNRHLWDAMRQSFGTRVQPLMIAATTAAYTTAAFALAEHEHSLRVQAEPWIDPARFVFARNTPTDADFRDEGMPACTDPGHRPPGAHRRCGGPDGTGWYYVAPGLGDFFSIETMRAELREVEQRPSALQAFRVFRLNQWVSSASGWLDLSIWDDGGKHAVTREMLRGRYCVGALDLSATQDFTAWVLLFPGSPMDATAPGFTVLPHLFIPRHAAAARQPMAERFAEWASAEYVTVTAGQTTDYGKVLDRITEDAEMFRIGPIGYDPWNATHLVSLLDDRGQQTVKVPQTAARLNDPTKQLETLLSERALAHGGHPVLRWMAGNVELDVTGDGLIKPSKAKSGEKIDGIAALVTALFVAGVPVDEEPRVTFIDLAGAAEPAPDFLAAWTAEWDD